MKFTVQRTPFLEALQSIQGIIATKPGSLAILANCLIEAHDNSLILTATDLDMSMRYTISESVSVSESGTTTLPVKRLIGITREMPEGEITFEIDADDIARVASDTTFFKLIGLNASNFPPLVQAQAYDRSFAIDQAIFRDMIKKVAYSASTDESRPTLVPILLEFNNSKLTMVATDGKRLALVEQELSFPDDLGCDILLPQRTANEMVKLLSDEGPMKISYSSASSLVMFETANLSVCSKVHESGFANYKQVIPESCDERIGADREAVIAALRRVSLVATGNVLLNSVRMTFENNALTCVMSSADVGEARETIPVKYVGEPITASYNPSYLLDCLKALDTEDEIIFELSLSRSPMMIKCSLPFLYVVMPLRV